MLPVNINCYFIQYNTIQYHLVLLAVLDNGVVSIVVTPALIAVSLNLSSATCGNTIGARYYWYC